ncbi:hypothetical protein [Streptomyces flavofungini]|uniref:hypothetical protein n=1 Tax=Streptomyces flavofungini TaxID=68200 RepID=UPI0025AF815D|nr:hypothetical protein [Streptomyces flavofungini]WJV48893.1 hypothetical protein QUY26_27300 [Streptomyces flavofungini]
MVRFSSGGDEYPDSGAQQSSPEGRDVQAHAGVAGASVTAESASIQTTTHLWLIWATITVDRGIAARRARHAALLESDSAEVSRCMRQEFDASLVAVADAVHALDALYGSTAVPQTTRDTWRGKGTKRHGKIREALKSLFETGPVQTKWVTDFEWLFDLRDAAAHPKESPQETVPHPLGTHSAPTFVDYSMESAIKACEITLAVLRRCTDNPRSSQPTALKWAAAHEPDIAELERRWTQA